MEKISVDNERLETINTAIQRSFFKIVDNWGSEIEPWRYRAFIRAMFSGNPGVNLNAIEKHIRITRKREGA